jgi:hypothetical protein
MREERGAVAGDLVVHEPYTLWGTVGGTVTVVEGGKFYMRGSILGDLNVEYGGRVHVFGNVAGSLKVTRGTKVIVSGTILGDAVNEGGRLFVDLAGEVKGKVKAIKGETKMEGRPVPAPDRPAAPPSATPSRDRREAEEPPGRIELGGPSLTPPPADLAAEAERLTNLLNGKAVARVWQHRPEAMGIEFADGTKLYIEQHATGLETNIIGRATAG